MNCPRNKKTTNQPKDYVAKIATTKPMNMADLPELLTLQQAAALINVHPNTLRNWEKSGRIEAVRIGARRDRRFPKAVIMAVFGNFAPLAS